VIESITGLILIASACAIIGLHMWLGGNMKKTIIVIALLSLTGCYTATGDTSVRPMVEHRSVIATAHSPFNPDTSDRDGKCEALMDRRLFLACKGGYTPPPPILEDAADSADHSSQAATNAKRDRSNFVGLNSFSSDFSNVTAYRYNSGRRVSSAYPGNCPTPESRDSAGRRCGKRSAASRPNGYTGYE
jgi:hypothetical protein